MVGGLLLQISSSASNLSAQVQSDTPSESSAQQWLTNLATEESKGSLKLVGFRKIDGIIRQILGTSVYEFEFEAEVEVLKTLKWRRQLFEGEFNGFSTTITDTEAQAKDGVWGGFFNASQNTGVEYKQGTIVHLTGVLSYERSENGWRVAARPSMKPISSSASAEVSSSESTNPTATIKESIVSKMSVSTVSDIVPGGSIGTFTHGMKVTGCYSATGLIDIQPRDRQFTQPCARTRALVHAGIDIAAPKGNEVRAIADGTVADVIATTEDPSF